MIQQFFFVFSVLFYNRVFRLFQGEDAINAHNSNIQVETKYQSKISLYFI